MIVNIGKSVRDEQGGIIDRQIAYRKILCYGDLFAEQIRIVIFEVICVIIAYKLDLIAYVQSYGALGNLNTVVDWDTALIERTQRSGKSGGINNLCKLAPRAHYLDVIDMILYDR